MRRLVAPLAFAAALPLAAPTARSSPTSPTSPQSKRTAKLSYQIAPAAASASCPDEATLRQSVAARLGYDPFTPDASRVVAVAVGRTGGELVATIEVREGVEVVGERKLRSKGSTCDELAGSVALSVAIAIDPLSSSGPVPSSSASSSAPASASASGTAGAGWDDGSHSKGAPSASVASTATTPADSESRPRYPELLAGVGVLAAIAAAPSLTFGATVSAEVRFPWLSVGLEGRADLEAASEGRTGGEVRSALLLGSIVPCVYHDVLMACPVLSLGALRGTGAKVGEPERQTTFYSAAGLRLGVYVPIGGFFAFRLYGDLLGVLTRTVLLIKTEEAWTTPSLTGTLGAQLLARF